MLWSFVKAIGIECDMLLLEDEESPMSMLEWSIVCGFVDYCSDPEESSWCFSLQCTVFARDWLYSVAVVFEL